MVADFSRRLANATQALAISLSSAQHDTLLQYIVQLQRWNRTYNLTALREPEQMLIQHLFDSLSVLKPMQTYLNQIQSKTVNIVDVGSGAGLPGVVLAATCSTWNVQCIDAVEKKTAFIRQMSAVLDLPNLESVHGRIEKIPVLNADIVISRAFSSLGDFVKLASRHVKEGGTMLAMKGKIPHEEIEALESESTWKVDRIEVLSVPELDAQRCLVWLNQQG